MSGLRKGGGCLTLLALPFFCLAVFMMLDPQKGATRLQSLMPGLFFGMVLLAPGLILYFVGRKADRDKEFMDSLTNLIRSHDRFTVAEIAMKTSVRGPALSSAHLRAAAYSARRASKKLAPCLNTPKRKKEENAWARRLMKLSWL